MDSTGDIHVIKKIKLLKPYLTQFYSPLKAIPSENSNKPVDPPQDIGVMALVAMMEPLTEYSSSKGPQSPLSICHGNKIWGILDTGSNGDLFFHEKGKPKPFSFLAGWCQSLGIHQIVSSTRSKLRIKFLDDYANSEH